MLSRLVWVGSLSIACGVAFTLARHLLLLGSSDQGLWIKPRLFNNTDNAYGDGDRQGLCALNSAAVNIAVYDSAIEHPGILASILFTVKALPSPVCVRAYIGPRNSNEYRQGVRWDLQPTTRTLLGATYEAIVANIFKNDSAHVSTAVANQIVIKRAKEFAMDVRFTSRQPSLVILPKCQKDSAAFVKKIWPSWTPSADGIRVRPLLICLEHHADAWVYEPGSNQRWGFLNPRCNVKLDERAKPLIPWILDRKLRIWSCTTGPAEFIKKHAYPILARRLKAEYPDVYWSKQNVTEIINSIGSDHFMPIFPSKYQEEWAQEQRGDHFGQSAFQFWTSAQDYIAVSQGHFNLCRRDYNKLINDMLNASTIFDKLEGQEIHPRILLLGTGERGSRSRHLTKWMLKRFDGAMVSRASKGVAPTSVENHRGHRMEGGSFWSFYDKLASTDAMFVMFGSELYYGIRSSATSEVALITNVPLLANKKFLQSYAMFDPSNTIFVDSNESEVDAFLKFLNNSNRDQILYTKKEALKQLSYKIIQRNIQSIQNLISPLES